MPDDQNTTQNPDSKENTLPTSPQSPTLDAPIPPLDSVPSEVPPEVPEDHGEGFQAKSTDIDPQIQPQKTL